MGSEHPCRCGGPSSLCLLSDFSAGAYSVPSGWRAEPRWSQDPSAAGSRTHRFLPWELPEPPLSAERVRDRSSPGAFLCPHILLKLFLRGNNSGATQTCKKKSHAQAARLSGRDLHSFIHPSDVCWARCWERSSHPDRQGRCSTGGDTFVGTRSCLCPANNSCLYLLNICVILAVILY